MSFSDSVGPGISNDIIVYVCFMHIHGGKWYTTIIIGHILYLLLIFVNGLNPSLAKPSLTLRFSAAKSGY